MFHWICPECGEEIAPGVKECPVCEPQGGQGGPEPHLAKATPSSTATPASPLVATSAVSVLEPLAPEPEIALQPEVVLHPQVVAKPDLPSIDLPVIQEAPPQAPEPQTFADRLADLAERLHGQHIRDGGQRMVPAAPRQDAERAPVILDVIPARPLLASPPAMLLLAEPQAPSVAAQIPVGEVFRPQSAAPLGRSIKPSGTDPYAPSVPNPVLLPDRPGRKAAPPLASLVDYHKAADRQMRPATYVSKGVASATEPKVTLAGPALPRELMSLQAAGLVPIGRGRKDAAGSNRYGWGARMLVLGILLTAGLAATFRVMPGNSASVPAKPAPEPAPEETVAPRNDHSPARFVEVTGIRFMELNKKPQIHYLVVNHSSAPLASVTVYVTLRPSHLKPGAPPLSRFSFRSPTLAAFEAKEMASPIERVIGPLELPDWQDLRADVEVQQAPQ